MCPFALPLTIPPISQIIHLLQGARVCGRYILASQQLTYNEVTSVLLALRCAKLKLLLISYLQQIEETQKAGRKEGGSGGRTRCGAISCSFGYNKEAATFDEWQPLITGAANLSLSLSLPRNRVALSPSGVKQFEDARHGFSLLMGIWRFAFLATLRCAALALQKWEPTACHACVGWTAVRLSVRASRRSLGNLLRVQR